jgi:hypothetical protein
MIGRLQSKPASASVRPRGAKCLVSTPWSRKMRALAGQLAFAVAERAAAVEHAIGARQQFVFEPAIMPWSASPNAECLSLRL